MDDDLRIRAMAAGDVPAVVRIHLDAFPEYFMTSLGAPFLQHFYIEALSEIAIVAEVGGHVQGFHLTISNPGKWFGKALRRRWMEFGAAALPAAAARPSAALKIASGVFKPVQARLPAGTATAMFTAVTPAARGRGLAPLMLRRMVVEGYERGVMTILGENDPDPRLCRLYEGMGFKIGPPEIDRTGHLRVQTEMDVASAYAALALSHSPRSSEATAG